jgi:hypothetical protein
MYFQTKNTLKNNIYHIYKHALTNLENGTLVITISNIENLKDHHTILYLFHFKH